MYFLIMTNTHFIFLKYFYEHIFDFVYMIYRPLKKAKKIYEKNKINQQINIRNNIEEFEHFNPKLHLFIHDVIVLDFLSTTAGFCNGFWNIRDRYYYYTFK